MHSFILQLHVRVTGTEIVAYTLDYPFALKI